MNANERLIGESRPLSLDPDGGGPLPTSPLHPGTSGAQPTLTASNEDVVVLASNVLVDGVDVDPSGTGGGISGGAGRRRRHGRRTSTSPTPARLGTQPGIEMDGTTGVNRFTGVTVTNGGSATAIGVRINNADRVLFANTAHQHDRDERREGARRGEHEPADEPLERHHGDRLGHRRDPAQQHHRPAGARRRRRDRPLAADDLGRDGGARHRQLATP